MHIRPMSGAPMLETERLLLRQWQASDVEPYGRMLADAATARFIVPGGQPVRPAGAWEHAAVMAGHWALHGTGMFVVESKAARNFLGRVGIWSPPGWFGLEVGWAVVPEARGTGLATEATVAALRWAFDTTQAPAIIHCIDEANLASQRLARRIGAEPGRAISLWGRDARIWTSTRATFEARPA